MKLDTAVLIPDMPGKSVSASVYQFIADSGSYLIFLIVILIALAIVVTDDWR